ncbi:MAG: DUF4124 domain-containing protein [Xanthomonadales bacterium]|nr:DUF4124 domain-containing protein [Xanthomonadales bacterium]
MRISTVLLCLLLAHFAAPASAETWVYRCEDIKGRTIFSDKPCHAIDALPLPSANDPPPRAVPPGSTPSATTPAEEMFDPAVMPRPVETDGCAGPDPGRLALALAEALAAADTNRVAAMFHWQGARRGTANQVFRQIGYWITQAPLHAIVVRSEHADDWLFAGLPPPPPGQEALPDIELVDNNEQSLARLGLIRNAGCVWLLPY